jgi:hypothetical protein
MVSMIETRYIFFILSHKRHNFRKKKLLNIKCVFRFSVQILSETLLILSRNERNVITKYILFCTSSIRYFCSILIYLEFYRQIFEKSSSSKCHENRSSASRVVACGRMGKLTGMTKLIVTFLNFANALENAYVLSSLRFIIFTQCYENSPFDSEKYTSTSWGSNPSIKIGFPPWDNKKRFLSGRCCKCSRNWSCVHSGITR